MSAGILNRGLAELGLGDAPGLADRLTGYIAAIEEWNPAYGLVGASGDELVVKHILDSLSAIGFVDAAMASIRAARGKPQAALSLADLGTGAGLPGIPLALARPDLEVFLVDRMTRRIRFLEAMKDSLSLDNVTIVENQVEHAKGCFDLITFRAFRPFERKLFKKVFGLCAADGAILAYKGRRDKASAELEAIEGLFGSAEISDVKVPFLDDPRCIVALRPAARQAAS